MRLLDFTGHKEMKLKDTKFCIIALMAIVLGHNLSCESDSRFKESFSLLNLSHLQHLSEEWISETDSITFVHIYAEYPSYDWVGDSDEGMACVDDASRAAIFYLRNYQITNNRSSLKSAKKLLNFILYMQAPNGLFYNFIYSDKSINNVHKNSIPKADWWSWRAIWALSEGYSTFKDHNLKFAAVLLSSIEQTFPAIDSTLESYPETSTEHGLELPTWLPYKTAADQAAVLILALVHYYRFNNNPKVKEYIEKLADGIILMQLGNSLQFPSGCFLSWKNLWHAYGNCQSYALIMAGEHLNNYDYIKHALLEIKHFYPNLIERQFLAAFSVSLSDSIYIIKSERQFSQIAYDMRPMIWASLKAYEITGEVIYAEQAAKISSWFFGNNIAGIALYDKDTGRCYDGMNDRKTINKNSGAESTIEALLAIQALEKNTIAMDLLRNIIKIKTQ
jgi:hypothetical protein